MFNKVLNTGQMLNRSLLLLLAQVHSGSSKVSVAPGHRKIIYVIGSVILSNL